MIEFKIYGSETSDILKGIEAQLGIVPNVFAVLGGNEQALEAFATLNGLFAQSDLSAIEREIVQTAASVSNACSYCVAGHTAFAQMQNLDGAEIAAVRSGAPIKDPKRQALRLFVQAVVSTRGSDASQELRDLLAAGYSKNQVFDVVLGITVKMFSNQVVGVTGLALDDAFSVFQWSAAENAAQAA
ncbi:MAG: carboxymuconolactone decarboxylase family protein [Stappiaceae bacterium]